MCLLWASIDNDDFRDLDQLSVAESLGNGAIKVLVAIADVDSIVKRGSPVDDHARANTTSVYTAAEVFPMLTEKLSTDLTSLAQDQERLSIVVELTVGNDAVVSQSDIYRARVVNRAKLAYRSVAAWLDGKAPAPERVAAVAGVDEQLRLQDRTAQALKKARHQHGALEPRDHRTQSRLRCRCACAICAADGEEPGRGIDRGVHGRGRTQCGRAFLGTRQRACL